MSRDERAVIILDYWLKLNWEVARLVSFVFGLEETGLDGVSLHGFQLPASLAESGEVPDDAIARELLELLVT